MILFIEKLGYCQAKIVVVILKENKKNPTYWRDLYKFHDQLFNSQQLHGRISSH